MRQSDFRWAAQCLWSLSPPQSSKYTPHWTPNLPVSSPEALLSGLGSTMGGVWMLKYLTAWRQAWHSVTHVRHGSIKGHLTLNMKTSQQRLGVVGALIPLLDFWFFSSSVTSAALPGIKNLIPQRILPGLKSALCQEGKPIKHPLLFHTEECSFTQYSSTELQA